MLLGDTLLIARVGLETTGNVESRDAYQRRYSNEQDRKFLAHVSIRLFLLCQDVLIERIISFCVRANNEMGLVGLPSCNTTPTLLVRIIYRMMVS